MVMIPPPGRMNAPARALPSLSEEELGAELAGRSLLTTGVRAAIDVAKEIHEHVRREPHGAPYLDEHVYPVAGEVAAYAMRAMPADAEHAVIVALLHDTVEDAPPHVRSLLPARLRDQFGDTVTTCVLSLTKPSDGRPKEEREREYFARVHQGCRIARLVKVFDRLNNLACVHLRGEAKRAEYVRETRGFHLLLAREVDPALAEQMEELMCELEG